ncbi:radical SAM protein [Alkaliphilus peptidifermentans]|uniref:Fe-S oxidoreductase n=1 Tax=Alkaliphilus peptidifermentans DSM 18978 TaxID=1120976 RepID=A0A1G5JLZ6_9FIRM|nr:radical SAM protein [Alkaliphilus peptidifermentans]SCY88920.1 Fe-S oxidoreductase [Alkaliphilus peptidifermentans DSM 18978]
MYSYPLYRPPSEAKSLIIQVTEGCSHNRCRFCTMYKGKSFSVKPNTEIDEQINQLLQWDSTNDRVFLADGNVLCLKTDKLLEIINQVKKSFPNIKRISAYAGPRDLINKTNDELEAIYKAGITMLYVGIESGNDTILTGVDKGATKSEIIEGCLKAQKAGFTLSVMLISGLGGQRLYQKHAIDSAEVVNIIQPSYLSLLTLLIDDNGIEEDLNKAYGYTELSPKEVLEETLMFLKELNLNNTVFRMNHASNYLTLKGILNKDCQSLISKIEKAIEAGVYNDTYLRSL